MSIPRSYPEPACDIAAQIRAMLDPLSPRDTVFIATRPEGVLLTLDRVKAALFADADSRVLGKMLGYPEDRDDVMALGDGVVVQALDRYGRVVIDALVNRLTAANAAAALLIHVPADGAMVAMSAEAVIGRRALLLEAENDR